MNFSKTGSVRIEQLRHEINTQVVEFPLMAIQWNQSAKTIEIEDIDGLATQYKNEIQAVVDAHIPLEDYFGDEVKRKQSSKVDTRFLTSQIANKTPEEIYAFLQNKINSWSNLQQAKKDLAEWLPLMASIIAWKVQK